MLSPLQLDDFVLEHLAVSRGKASAPSSKLPEEIAYEIKADYSVETLRKISGRARYSVSLVFQMDSQAEDGPVPVKALLAAVSGTFSFAAGTPKELLDRLVPANCLAILFGILRGIVIQTTSGCSGGCFILPSLSIHALIALKESNEELSETVTAVLGPPKAKPRRKAKRRAKRKVAKKK